MSATLPLATFVCILIFSKHPSLLLLHLMRDYLFYRCCACVRNSFLSQIIDPDIAKDPVFQVLRARHVNYGDFFIENM